MEGRNGPSPAVGADSAGIEVFTVPQADLELAQLEEEGVEVYTVDAAELRQSDTPPIPDATGIKERGKAGGQRSWENSAAAFTGGAAFGWAQKYRDTASRYLREAQASGMPLDQFLAQQDTAQQPISSAARLESQGLDVMRLPGDRRTRQQKLLDAVQSYVAATADTIQHLETSGKIPMSKARRMLAEGSEAVSADSANMSTLERVGGHMAAFSDAVSEDPFGLLYDLGAENSVQLAEMLVGAGAARGAMAGTGKIGATAGEMLGAGATSAFNEFGTLYVEARQKGLPHEDAWSQAAKKAGVTAFFDAASMGVTGKAVDDILKKGFLDKIKAGARGTAFDAGAGMAGEFWGQAAQQSSFEKVNIGDVLTEGFAELTTAGPQMASQAASRLLEGARGVEPTPAEAPPAEPLAPESGDMSAESAFGAVEPGDEAPVASEPGLAAGGAPETVEVDASAVDTSVAGGADGGAVSQEAASPDAQEEEDPFSPEATQRASDLDTALSYVSPPSENNGRLITEADDGGPAKVGAKVSRVVEPGHPAWASRPGKIRPPEAKAAIEKARRGEALSKPEQRFVDHMLDFVKQEREYQQAVPEESRITAEDLAATLLEPEDMQISMLAQRARQMGADADAVDAALESQSDDMATEKLNALIAAIQPAAEEPSPDQAAAAAPGKEGEAATQKNGWTSSEVTGWKWRKHARRGLAGIDSMVPHIETRDGKGRPGLKYATKDGEISDEPVNAVGSHESIFTTDDPAVADKVASLIEAIQDPATSDADYEKAKQDLKDLVTGGKKPAAGTDLFGSDSATRDALNAKNAKVARKLGDGRKAPPPGGMFAAADEKAAADARAAQTDLDTAAHAAATSPTNDLPEPTDAQKDAGNYQMGHVKVAGLDISIENPKGSVRRSKEDSPRKWEVTMPHHYGYIRGTTGADGDHVDISVGPDADSERHTDRVFVIDQKRIGGDKFDEHKAFIGFSTANDAVAAHRDQFDDKDIADQIGGKAVTLTTEEFKRWLAEGDTSKPIAGAPVTSTLPDPSKGWKGGPTAEITVQQIAGKWRFSAQASGSTGDFGSPMEATADNGYATEQEARDAARAELLSKMKGEKEYGRIEKWARMLGPQEVAPAAPKPDKARLIPTRAPGGGVQIAVEPAKPEAAESPATIRHVSANTIFTEDAAAKARALLKAKLGQLNAGLDPELIQAGITMAGYHVEKGARTFAAYSAAMIEDLGEAVKPYLRSWYEAVRWDPRAAALAPEMTSAEDIAAESSKQINADIEETIKAKPPVPGIDPIEGILNVLRREQPISKKNLANALPQFDAKQLEEAIETAIVIRAREIVAEADSELDAYNALRRLYDQQPNLSTRTSTSVEQQAYSTPAPLAYLASRLAGVTKDTAVLEPTAGNGMLLIEATPRLAQVNELNAARADALARQGFRPTEKDAATEKLRHAGYPVDVVLANPPFGAVREAGGQSKVFQIELPDNDGYGTTNIDHAISFNALKHLKPDGRAVLIVGSVAKTAASEEARSDAYNGSSKRKFYYHLYKHYNVTDHFTVSGDLYAKQGAAWPVDVIVIQGKGKSSLTLPAAAVPRVYDSWDALKGLLPGESSDSTSLGSVSRPVDDRAGSGAGVERAEESGSGAVPEPAGRPAAAPAGEPGGSTGSAEPDARAAGASRPVERPAAGAERGGERAGAEQPAAAGTPVGGGSDAAAQGQAAGARDAGGTGAAANRPEGSAERTRELAGAADAAALTGSTQQPYRPASTVPAIGTLVPTNMRDATAAALSALEARVGKVETFVANSLGWKEEDVGKYLGAEQVDGVALALDQISQRAALVIGDQTGVGKGRQVAAAIRFALRQGMIPVFVTEKPNLYSDIYRDLVDIGQQDVRPLVTNAALRLPLDENETVFLTSPGSGKHNTTLAEVARSGDLGEFNMVFTTYNQMQTVGGKSTTRMDLLNALGPRAMLILDESHNAGGQQASSRGGDDEGEKQGRAGFVRGLVGQAQAVVYSSATWAKRPDVMDLYSKTDMALAVEGDVKLLPGAITRGGVPLQQAVASMLARTGQYIRREKSFEGIEYNTPQVDVDLDAAEALSSVMLAVRQFDTLKAGAVKALDKAMKAEGKLLSEGNSTGGAGASSTNFTSIMHNLIDQMLLALKAENAVARALARRAEGKKVVLTVSNTMGSFIGEYAAEAGLKPGDAISLSFKDLMLRYLERSRDVLLKGPDGRSTRRRLTDSELGGGALAQFNAAKRLIEESDQIGRLPVSPIDYIHAKLRAAGVKSGEITGRSEMIDYSGAVPTYRVRPSKEVSPGGRKQTINSFNSGQTDMLILNQAGSTGLSLHASSKYKDKTPRWMVIVQAEKNIDTHMQMLGRINRTGQVVLPGYDQLTANIPAEKRPAAVLAKKMASLNANTTAARGSAVTSKDTVDFLNIYGDEVVAQLMADMPEIHEKLGEPLSNSGEGDGFEREDAARKVSGRIPLLPVKEQEELYELIESGYKAALAQADALGENALEAKTYDLDARTIERTVLFEGNGSSSPFAQGAHLEEVNVKRQGKPYTSDQVQAKVREELEIPDDTKSWTDIKRDGFQQGWKRRTETDAEAARFRESLNAKLMLADLKESELKGRLGQFDGLRARWNDIAGRLDVGASYALQSGENRLYAVLTSVTRKKGVKLPVALGSWEAHFAIADASRTLTLPFSRLAHSGGGLGELGKVAFRQTDLSETGKPILKMFDDGQNQTREDRVIITGNLLAGFAKVKGGAIINYTTSKGAVRQGILMPRSFDLEEFSQEQPVELTAAQVLPFFKEAPRAILESSDGALTVRKADNDYMIAVPKSKSGGGEYFLDRGLTGITGDFQSRGDKMIARVSSNELEPAMRHLSANGVKFQTKSFTLEARAVGGTQMASQKVAEDPAEDDDGSLALDERSAAQRGESKVLPTSAMRSHAAAITQNSQLQVEVVEDGNMSPFVASIVSRFARNADRRRRWRAWAGIVNGKPMLLLRAGRFESLADMERTVLHEAFHHGIRAIMGKAFTDYASKVYQRLGKGAFDFQIRSYFEGGAAFDETNPNHVAEVVNEFMAKMAESIEQGTASEKVKAAFDAFLNWLQKALRGLGWRVTFTKAQLRQAVRRSVDLALAGDLGAPATANESGGFSLEEQQQQEASDNTKNWILQNLAEAAKGNQTIDRMFRMAVTPFGYVKDGKFRFYSGYAKAGDAAQAKAEEMAKRGFSWLAPQYQHAASTVALHLKHGFGDRIGTPEDFIGREEQKFSAIRTRLREVMEMAEQMMQSAMSKEELKLLQSALTGEQVDDAAIRAVAAPIVDAIEDMGKQLVDLGMLSAETFERNRRAYLHRSYLNRELQFANGMTQMVHKWGDARRARIRGDVFRGRGIREKVSTDVLWKSVPPDFWGKGFDKEKIDVALKGTKWRMLDRVLSPTVPEQAEMIPGGSGRKDRVLQRVYWPADAELPAKFAGFKDRGTFEVKDVSAGAVTLWRDYTKDERTRMGEILDARYNIVKTYSLMVQDLENGKFFSDIAKNPDWAQRAPPTNEDGSDNWIPASESIWVMRAKAGYAEHEWVKVPSTKVPGTQVHRYGQLAGMYVKAPIWRDIAELEALNTPGVWRTLLQQWKTNKTARSPVVHMNNIMSNFVLMDLHDIRLREFKDGVLSYFHEDAHYQDAYNHGLFGNNALDKDIRDKYLKPLLKEIQAAATEAATAGPISRVQFMHRVVDAIKNPAKWADDKLQFAYQAEDEVFRMAAYMKLVAEGNEPYKAAAIARRQFIDYDIRAPYVNALRTTVLPFISYVYRAVPLVAQAVYKRPWKLAKYYAIAYALQAASYALMGEDDEEQERQRRMMDEQFQGKTWIGVDRMLRIPANDRYGNPLYWDIQRWVPASDVADFNGNIIEWMPASLQVGGPVVLGTELALNINLFRDEPIYEDIDTRGESLKKAGKHLWMGLMPNIPMIPSYSQENIANALGWSDREFNAAGEKKSLGREILGSMGVKIRSQSEESNVQRINLEYEASITKLSKRRSSLRRQAGRGNLSPEEYASELDKINEKRQKYLQERNLALYGQEPST